MNETEYILTVTVEECTEVAKECLELAQRCTKALRFGLTETQPGEMADNEVRLWKEVEDLQGSLEMLVDLRGKGGTTRAGVDAKKARVRKFMRYSEQLGCLQTGNVAA